MRKTVALLMSIIILITLSGCGQKVIEESYYDYAPNIVSKAEASVNVASENNDTSVSSKKDISSSSPVKSETDKGSVVASKPATDNSAQPNKYSRSPISMTLSLYEGKSYGVTYITYNQPSNPVVQVSEGTAFKETGCMEFKATFKKYKSYDCLSEGEITLDSETEYYVVKAVITGLRAGKSYSYRCCDSGASLASKAYTFTARNTDGNAVKFVHVSDSQDNVLDINGAKPYQNVIKGIEMNKFSPDFMLHTGDMVEYTKYERYWTYLFSLNQKHFATVPYAALSGNHETTYRNGSFETYKHFNIKAPEQDTERGVYYSFDYGNTRFIMLNTNRLTDNKLTEDQYNWLVSTLKSNKQKWTIVSMHNPLYSVGKWGTSQGAVSLALREQLVDLFAEYKVDLVLQGHDHTYSKTYPIGKGGVANTNLNYETIDGVKYCTNANGTIYAMNGPSGGQWRSPVSVDKALYEFGMMSYVSSWAEVEIKDNLLKLTTYYYYNGKNYQAYSYGIKK